MPYLAPLEAFALAEDGLAGIPLWDCSCRGSGRLTFLFTFPDAGLTCRRRALT